MAAFLLSACQGRVTGEMEPWYPHPGERHPCAPGKGMLGVQPGCVWGWGQWGGGGALPGRQDMGMSLGSSRCGQARPSWRARKSSPGSLMGLGWATLGSGQTPGCGTRRWGGERSSPCVILWFSPWLGMVGNDSEYLRIFYT